MIRRGLDNSAAERAAARLVFGHLSTPSATSAGAGAPAEVTDVACARRDQRGR
jgi:hypothetical protein